MSESSGFPDPLEGFESEADLVTEHEIPTEPAFEPAIESTLPPGPLLASSVTGQAGPYMPSPWRGVTFVFGIAGALIGSAIAASSSVPAPVAPAAATAAATEPTSEAAPDTAKDAQTRIDGLAEEIKALAKSLDAVKTEFAAAKVDVTPIETKIVALTKRVDDGSPKLAGVEAKLDALSKTLQTGMPDLKAIDAKIEKAAASVSSEIATLKSKTEAMEKSLAAEKATVAALLAEKKTATAPKPATTNAAEIEFAKAVDLFKKNRFDEATTSFTQLQTTLPTDARVWYYAALSNGFATGDWTTETARLVTKGIELERAGSPASATIDSTFADLAPATAKTWLDAYRTRAR